MSIYKYTYKYIVYISIYQIYIYIQIYQYKNIYRRYFCVCVCVCVCVLTETLMISMKESSCESWSAFSCSSEFMPTRSFFSACRRATWARRASSSALLRLDAAA